MLVELAPLFSALLTWAAFPPLNWGGLAFVAPAPLLVAIRRAPSGTRAGWYGFGFGIAFFGAFLFWLHPIGYLGYVGLTILMATFCGLYGLGLGRARWWPETRFFVVAVGGWALMELLRSVVPLGGFPWGLLGYAAGVVAPPRAATQFIGVSGWSVLMVAVGAGLAIAVERRSAPKRFLGGAVGVALVVSVIGALNPPSADGARLRVAVVQGSSPCPQIHCENESRIIFNDHLSLTRQLSPGSVDLVVWPESSAGSSVEPRSFPENESLLAAEARRLNAYFLVGASRSQGDQFSNLNLLYSPGGEFIGEYHKQHAVPFGEYVPLRGLFGRIPATDQVPRDLLPGDQEVVFPLPSGGLGTVISFEGSFSSLVAQHVRAGAGLVVVNTNVSSFGPGSASDVWIGMTRMRAAEFGVDLVHAAITGKSAMVRADGSLAGQTRLLNREILTGEVGFRTASLTLYARWGDWLQRAAVLGLAGVVAIAVWEARRAGKPRRPPTEERAGDVTN